ncbi:MAG TPA: hypothetical protein VG815_15515, partial [Chloroflexota bacterium]|nr:hypothetical protein [Chloroflexota bacterium]
MTDTFGKPFHLRASSAAFPQAIGAKAEMRRFAALLALGLSVLTLNSGCVLTDWRLRKSVVTQASTLTELQYQQVLGN